MGLSNAEIKKINRNNIFRYLLRSEVVSRNGIAHKLELTAPTVTSTLNELQEMGLVKEEGAMDSNGGRKSMGYSCNRDAKYAVGVNISKDYVDLAIVNLAMTPVCTKHKKIQIKGEEASYQWLQKFISDAITETHITKKRILGICYALPAIIDESGRKIYGLHEEMDLPRNFYEIVKAWFSYPAVLRREAVCAGSAVANAMDIEAPVIYLNISPSVGGAVIKREGQVKLGLNCRKGEFGHITLVPHGKQCFCGRKGCVNAYCSTDNLTVFTGGDLSAFFEGIKEGRPEYVSAWEEYLDYLALTIHNLMTSFDERLILGGNLAKYLKPYMETIRERVAGYDHYLRDVSYLSYGALEFDTASIGAAGYFIDEYIKNI